MQVGAAQLGACAKLEMPWFPSGRQEKTQGDEVARRKRGASPRAPANNHPFPFIHSATPGCLENLNTIDSTLAWQPAGKTKRTASDNENLGLCLTDRRLSAQAHGCRMARLARPMSSSCARSVWLPSRPSLCLADEGVVSCHCHRQVNPRSRQVGALL